MEKWIPRTKKWISMYADGKSFVDIGGLWGTKGERVSDALLAGARSATMADIMAQDHHRWRDFDARCASLGLSEYRKVTADIMASDAPATIGQHDIVYCSGIIYHMADPIGCLRNLRAIAQEYLILVSMVVPHEIRTPVGDLDLTGGETLFVPAITDHQKAILSAHFDAVGVKVHAINGTEVEQWTKDDGTPYFGPWWWTFTPTLLESMIEAAGFEVVKHGPVMKDKSHGFLCRKL